MIHRASYAPEIALARGKTRSARVAGRTFAAICSAIFALVLTGCATAPKPCLTRTEIQRVPQPVFVDLPDELIEPLALPPLPPAPSNRDLEADIAALEELLDRAQADRDEIRRLQRDGAERQERQP